MMPKNTAASLRESILASQRNAPPKKGATELLTGELGEACQTAREMFRSGEISSVLRLYNWLVEEHGYPYGRDAFRAFLKAQP